MGCGARLEVSLVGERCQEVSSPRDSAEGPDAFRARTEIRARSAYRIGWPDILQLNGALLDNTQLYHQEVSKKGPLLIFRNLERGQFEKVCDSLGADFMRSIAGRGLATGAYDNDDDMDIVTNNRSDYPSLLRNDRGNANHWLEILLIGTKSNRVGIAASLKFAGDRSPTMEQAEGRMSHRYASDPRIQFGLGKRAKIDSLEITLPSGQIDRLTNVPIDEIIAVKEGAGMVNKNFPKIPPTQPASAPSKSLRR